MEFAKATKFHWKPGELGFPATHHGIRQPMRLSLRKSACSNFTILPLFHRVAQLEESRIGIGKADETLGGVLDL
jgi:hypothetical protein